MCHKLFGIEDSGMNDKDIVSDIMEPHTFHGTYYHRWIMSIDKKRQQIPV